MDTVDTSRREGEDEADYVRRIKLAFASRVQEIIIRHGFDPDSEEGRVSAGRALGKIRKTIH
jgi:hypothetical protein